MFKRILQVIFVFALFLPTLAIAQKGVQLFRPDDKENWHLFLSKTGKDNDPLKVFTFEGNTIHVSGEDFGYIVSKKAYGNFHLTLEFKWAEKKFPPREKEKRDAGILYHVDFHNGDKVWPRSLEYQIQEGDCGDFWLIDSTSIVHADTLTTPTNYRRIQKKTDSEKPKGEWNRCEVIVRDGNITHIINGVVVNQAKLGNTKTGFILLQSEGAELYYRNVFVQPL